MTPSELRVPQVILGNPRVPQVTSSDPSELRVPQVTLGNPRVPHITSGDHKVPPATPGDPR